MLSNDLLALAEWIDRRIAPSPVRSTLLCAVTAAAADAWALEQHAVPEAARFDPATASGNVVPLARASEGRP